MRRTLTGTLAGALLVTGLTGCGPDLRVSPPTPPPCLSSDGPLVLVVGARSNSPQPTFTAGLNTEIRATLKARHSVYIVRLDGSPAVVFDKDFVSDAGNGTALDSDVDEWITGLSKVINNDVPARQPEVDLLKALSLAGKLAGQGGSVAVIDSALATKGDVDFTRQGLLSADPQDIAGYLKTNKLLPDLTGRKVLFEGLGYATAPQLDLPDRSITNLGRIWTTIATTAGASCAKDEGRPSSSGSVTGRPAVSTVPLPPGPQPPAPCGDTVLSNAGDVGFVRGTADFRDPGAAKTWLRQLAQQLKTEGTRVELIGTTSSEGGDAINQPLSERRAEKVRDTLVSLGVSEGNIAARGVGVHWPDHVPDLLNNGDPDPIPANRNRKVIVRLPQCRTS